MNKDISLGVKVEQQRPIFLKHTIASYTGDYKRLTFKISFKDELFFVECQVSESLGKQHIYIITRCFESLVIDNVWEFYEQVTEEEAVSKICEFLDKRFP